MAEDKVKKYVALIRLFLCLSGVCFIVGFILAASSPNNVFIGIAVMIVGFFFSAVMALVPAVKLIKLQKEQKENRIKKLEEEVELLKQKQSD